VTARPLSVLALLCALGFVATFLVALHTGQGLHDDAALFRHVSGNASVPVRAAGAARTLLLGIDGAFVAVAAVLLVVFALLQKRVARAFAVVAMVACSVGSVEALKHGLPQLGVAIPAGPAADVPERAHEHRGLPRPRPRAGGAPGAAAGRSPRRRCLCSRRRSLADPAGLAFPERHRRLVLHLRLLGRRDRRLRCPAP